ncbi:MAG: sigma-70 family RNA polymerase sigma factor [Anaerolineales bacterium]|nr:sigma-70 family RNA polymerase sigma factor [Anaerolineales bacterium]
MSAAQRLAEAEYIARARNGDDAAFHEVVNAFQGPVFNLCYRMLGNPQEAEDAAQETFLKAYRNLRSYNPDRKFTNWILSIASNHCVDRLRKRRLQLISLDEWLPRFENPAPNPGPEQTLTDKELQEDVREILDRLGSTDRAAIVLRYWYEYSYEEIAEALSLSVPAVKSRLHRARRSLAEQWSPQSAVFVNGGV